MNFRFVSSGQAVEDSAIFTQIIRGNSLRPLSPANVRGHRDSQGNLLIEWTRRSRIASGLRPLVGVPLGEETEHYEVEILNGSNVVLRTLFVDLTQAEPAILLGTPSNIGTINGNSMVGTGLTTFAKQSLDRVGSFVEANLVAVPSGGSPTASIGMIETSYTPMLGMTILADQSIYRSTIQFAPVASPPGITVLENASGDPPPSSQKFTGGTLGSVTATRVRAIVNATGVDYYWDYTGAGNVPFYRSDLPAPLPLTASFSTVGTGAEICDVFIGHRETPSTTYDTAKQIIDFGSTQSSIRVRVYQVSAIVGRGPFTQAYI